MCSYAHHVGRDCPRRRVLHSDGVKHRLIEVAAQYSIVSAQQTWRTCICVGTSTNRQTGDLHARSWLLQLPCNGKKSWSAKEGAHEKGEGHVLESRGNEVKLRL